MYPAHFFAMFPPFPQDDTAFVAMSFRPEFQDRWTRVIEPAIREAGLRPYRVDASKISDSIITEILSGIGKARLIFADISTDTQGVRNGNVMYEVGIAHATRQPQEVILFRSDSERLLFDISNIRVNKYNPDENPAASKQGLKEAFVEAIREIDLTRSMAVERTLALLDSVAAVILLQVSASHKINDPPLTTMRQVVGNMPQFQAIRRLIELGLLSTSFKLPTGWDSMNDAQIQAAMEYYPTELGKTVAAKLERRLVTSK